MRINRKTITRKQNWEEKHLYGHLVVNKQHLTRENMNVDKKKKPL